MRPKGADYDLKALDTRGVFRVMVTGNSIESVKTAYMDTVKKNIVELNTKNEAEQKDQYYYEQYGYFWNIFTIEKVSVTNDDNECTVVFCSVCDR